MICDQINVSTYKYLFGPSKYNNQIEIQDTFLVILNQTIPYTTIDSWTIRNRNLVILETDDETYYIYCRTNIIASKIVHCIEKNIVALMIKYNICEEDTIILNENVVVDKDYAYL